MKKNRIYGTIGPACCEAEVLKKMFSEGMDGIRLNLSHTTLDEAAGMIEVYREAARELGITPELLIDMQGPELRIGALKQPIRLNTDDVIGTDSIPFPKEVIGALKGSAIGQELLLDDGKILLKAEKPGLLRVIRGGLLESKKSVALPGCDIRTPAMTETDREQIKKAKPYGVTGLMQPFVRSKDDLIEVRNALLKADCGNIRLFAKIENMAGVESLDELIPYCDEIVIARGDLGNAMELWELPAVQKRIAEACRKAGRDFMVVTQMLDSMIARPVPTRAEVSDIFNAVLDGASSVMVTGETATGKYPVDAIRYLAKTAREAEAYISSHWPRR